MNPFKSLPFCLLLTALPTHTASADGKTKSPFVQKLENGTSQTIVVYGTSLSASGQWPRQFAAVLSQQFGDKAVIKNAARSGSDSNWGLAHIASQVFVHSPDVLFIEFSMNDAITVRGTSITKARGNLEKMIAMTRERFPDCEIILMSMNPSLRSGKSLQRPELARYYDSYRELAAQLGLQFIDNHQAWLDFLGDDKAKGLQHIPDNIHPNGLGSQKVITPSILQSIGIDFKPEDIPRYEDPPPGKKAARNRKK